MIQDATTQDELVEELSKTASLPRLENALSTETLQVAVEQIGTEFEEPEEELLPEDNEDLGKEESDEVKEED